MENLGRQLQDLQQLADKLRGPSFGADGGAKAQDGRGVARCWCFCTSVCSARFDGCATESDARNLQSLLPSSGPVDESDPELAELCSIYAPPPLEDDLGDQANMVREQMLDMAQSVLGKILDREALMH